jgi:hypothetical protein
MNYKRYFIISFTNKIQKYFACIYRENEDDLHSCTMKRPECQGTPVINQRKIISIQRYPWLLLAYPHVLLAIETDEWFLFRLRSLGYHCFLDTSPYTLRPCSAPSFPIHRDYSWHTSKIHRWTPQRHHIPSASSPVE